MWIDRVELINIKSYGSSTTIDLAQGVNAIYGQNGAGKSTILEAIGLALFGQSSYKNQDQLINLRAKKGEIIITVIDSRDDRAYEVIRPLKGGTPYVYDPEVERQVASGVTDVLQWLRDCMGVEPNADLQALFKDAVGVSQGMLTASFLLNPAPRKNIFDPLLGVEDYEKVFANMRPVVRHVTSLQTENEKTQERLAGRLEDLSPLQNETRTLKDTIQAAELEYQRVSQELTELSQELDLLKQQQESIQELESEARTLGERREGMEAQLKAAGTALEQARQAQQKVEQCEADHQTYEQAEQEREDLEEKRKERDELQLQLGECQQALALAQQAVADFEKQLAAIAEAEARLIELKPLVEKQETLEQEHNNAEKAVADLKTAEQRVGEEEERLENLQNDLANVKAQIEKREETTQEIQRHQTRRSKFMNELEALDQKLGGLESQLGEVGQALQAAQDRLREYENLAKAA